MRRGRRTPHGVRGLKYDGEAQRGAHARSHPSRGAWIEIRTALRSARPRCRRTPHGVRGLKYRIADGRAVGRRSHPSRGAWIEMMLMVGQFDAALVAPLTGCVD